MSLTIACPQCAKKLKLPGREVLGKAAKCPSCGHRFYLRSLDEQPPSSSSAQPDTPTPRPAPLGLEPRYVPDVVAQPVSEDQTPTAQDPSFDFSEPATSSPTASVSQASSLDDYKTRRAARKKRNRVLGLVGVGLVATIGGGIAFWLPDDPPTPVPQVPVALPETVVTAEPTITVTSPTRGRPVPTSLLPVGTSLIVHMRPAELWSEQTVTRDVVAALPPSLKPSLEATITSLTNRSPSEIAELTFGIVLGSRGSEPRVTAVVQTVTPNDIGKLLQEFRGDVESFGEMRLVTTDDRAIFIENESTFAVTPRSLAADYPDAVNTTAGDLALAISPLVERTDRERLITFLIDPNDLNIHADKLVSGPVGTFIGALLKPLDDPSAVAWSLHTGEHVYSEFLIVPPKGVSSKTYQSELMKRLEAEPSRLSTRLKLTNPSPQGVRDLVGRFPAMLEAARRSTVVSADERGSVIELRTLLPPIAGPNLALASVLTFNTLSQPVTTTAPVASPQIDTRTVLEKLETPVDAEFARVPLQEALAYLAEEAGLGLEIDGDALKDSGYTRNMAQTFDLGRVPVRDALAKIVSQYDQMVVVADESRGVILVLTKKFAEQRGLTPIEW